MELEIKKLEDIITWADSWIEGVKPVLIELGEFEVDNDVKQLEAVKKVVLEAINRHNTYTNALNQDIADKAAKIDLLEKELEGRKEGYTALKELMDTKYISIDEHNRICKTYEKKIEKLEKESEKWQDLAKMNRDTICNQYDVCEDFKNKIAELEEKVKHQRENLDGINKTLEIRTKENESLIKVRNNLNKEIEAHEHENKRLSEKIVSMHNTITELSHDIDNYKSWNVSLHKDIKELKKKKEDDYGKSGFKRYIEHLIEEEERAVPERFKERLNKEITEIFTKEEETVKYRPSEIDRFTNFLKDEVDKKRIVDIGEGAEKILGVSRELFDAAIKALVDDGYQEIIGRIPQATNSYVYMDMHVLATPDVETKETANAENIKSLDFDIPCGEDAIE